MKNTARSFPSTPRRCRGCLLRGLLSLLLLGGAGGLTLQLFGDTLVPALVDTVRGVIGPAATAQIEAAYYGVVETTYQWRRDLGLAPKVTAPWAAAPTPPAALQLSPGSTRPPTETGAQASLPTNLPPAGVDAGSDLPANRPPTPELTAGAVGPDTSLPPVAGSPLLPGAGPPALLPVIRDGALAGEGLWTATGLPLPPGGAPPVFWKTFWRPDAARPDVLVYLVRFDPHRVRLHLTAGRKEPVSPAGVQGSGQVASADLPNLAAAFNGGFKSINGHYGMMVAGHLIAPPNPAGDTATLAVHADGRIEVGPWQTLNTASDLVSYRQNCPLMIDNGTVVVQAHSGSAWGLTVLNAMYVWRSGIGITADGDLIYAAGNRLSISELAGALRQAGAVYAMQLDINSAWVHWLNYTPDAKGKLHPTPLVPGMSYHPDQYLAPGDRDFFYLTWH